MGWGPPGLPYQAPVCPHPLIRFNHSLQLRCRCCVQTSLQLQSQAAVIFVVVIVIIISSLSFFIFHKTESGIHSVFHTAADAAAYMELCGFTEVGIPAVPALPHSGHAPAGPGKIRTAVILCHNRVAVICHANHCSPDFLFPTWPHTPLS